MTASQPLLRLSKSSTIGHRELVSRLSDWGYTRCPVVSIPGEFAVRGSLIDVFGITHTYPIRIEYDHTGIDRIAGFDPHTQRTTGVLPVAIIPHTAIQASPVTFQSMEKTHTELLSEWKMDDYVVHETFGIGQYKGLVHLDVRDRDTLPTPTEYIWLQYKGEDKVYIPLQQLPLITKYISPDDTPTLNSLHDGQWNKTKAAAKRHLETLVESLLALYQKRQHQRGYAYPEDSLWQLEFENHFPYTPTAGQVAAIKEIKHDMEQPFPMDRLLCGDVGYGKSEVLLRAVFKAVDAGKQVVILVPTTLLARQHFQLASERFAPFPFRLALLSRLVPPAVQKAQLKDLEAHKIDIVIGTHRALQKDVVFADLGLIVIDEEQRFGVKDKESLKEKWPNTDILTVSATPIPRTLYMSLTGAKNMSTITDPPPHKKPILTTITPKTDTVIQWAIQEELNREGQVFYLHNRIEDLHTEACRLQTWFPQARIGTVHGQMAAKTLDTLMNAFAKRELDILVCTSIVENGLDIPNANTIILDHAARLGLSQIYQLRGRVGRSTTQGYAYLLYDADTLTAEGKKRLDALKEFVSLGSGYHLAMRDLEMRGAGTMLGYQQHGSMTAIGFELYCSMLQTMVNPVSEIKPWSTDIVLYIPDAYIPDESVRLGLYTRLIKAAFPYQIDALLEDCKDRFGPIPDSWLGVCLARKHVLEETDA